MYAFSHTCTHPRPYVNCSTQVSLSVLLACLLGVWTLPRGPSPYPLKVRGGPSSRPLTELSKTHVSVSPSLPPSLPRSLSLSHTLTHLSAAMYNTAFATGCQNYILYIHSYKYITEQQSMSWIFTVVIHASVTVYAPGVNRTYIRLLARGRLCQWLHSIFPHTSLHRHRPCTHVSILCDIPWLEVVCSETQSSPGNKF